MYNELRKEAKKKVEAKMAFFICAIVFTCATVLLLMLGITLPVISMWLWLPIPAFIMVLGILYLNAFGFPAKGTLSLDWQEEEIEKEMVRLYRKKKAALPPLEELSESERLELKELDRLQKEREWDDDLV